MRFRLVAAMAAFALTAALLPPASEAKPHTGKLRAVVFDDLKPFIEKQGSGYAGLAVDVLNAIKDESGARAIQFMPASSVEQGLEAVTSGRAHIACAVAFTWERSKSALYTLPFAVGGTRLLAPAGIDGTPDSLQGRSVGVVENSAAAEVIASVVPEARLQGFKTPAEALAALNSKQVSILAGPSFWLMANKGSSGRNLVPTSAYGRSGIGCIVAPNNPSLLSASNLAIAQMMQAYVDGDAGTREMVNRWVGPGSAIQLPEDQITAFYTMILTATAEISTGVKGPGN